MKETVEENQLTSSSFREHIHKHERKSSNVQTIPSLKLKSPLHQLKLWTIGLHLHGVMLDDINSDRSR